MKTWKKSEKEHKKPEQRDEPRKKKEFGQHFLQRQSIVDHMIAAVKVLAETSILEIGCGDGFLTTSILKQTECKQLVVYEIDPEWAAIVQQKIKDPRLDLRIVNILDADWRTLEANKPWVMLANLPYQITFPIIHRLVKNKDLFTQGVVMVQEEVAQKITAGSGKKYGPTSLYLQHHFSFKLLDKIPPQAFNPPPKVDSRLMYFQPRYDQPIIPDEEKFWKFIAQIFQSPRQTLRNNLKRTHYQWDMISSTILALRAQQLSFNDFLMLWETIRNT